MNESTNSENNSSESEKPVLEVQKMDEEIKFPPFPGAKRQRAMEHITDYIHQDRIWNSDFRNNTKEPTDEDFEEGIEPEEKDYYKNKFKDLNTIVSAKLHCTACDRHLGCSAKSELRMRAHPMLRTLMCYACHTFYNSGEFEKGDDGSELYCRWCGQGGQVYCCSDCPHVFCAKCIKRNFGMGKIKEIEETDDWKCFKCNSKCLWDLRAVCWAVFRYCDLKNKITYSTEDAKLKEAYQKECQNDLSECCRNKGRRREKSEDKKPKQKEETKKALSLPTPVKPPATIQVKKFASINIEDNINRIEKKVPYKRPASPKNKPIFIRNPMAAPKILTPVIMPPMPKKMRMPGPTIVSPIRFNNDRKPVNSYARIRPKQTISPIMYNGYSGNTSTTFNNMVVNDNINLSLESLTQGLDMAAVAGIQANNIQKDDVVCTPDFPLEPLCEVVEDNNDDDVQCIGPVVTSKNPPPLVSRNLNPMPDALTDNIIQMTENDVTVNAETGGLKFRVDPQTLSSNKMYRLPDGRIFAINANPSMPGGYSATIVAVSDDSVLKLPPKGATYAAKLSSVGPVASPMLTPPPLKICRTQDKTRSNSKSKRSTPKSTNKVNKKTETPKRDLDLNVPVEWFRYNLIDAVDSLEYSLTRLNKLKHEATTTYLRTRTVSEMRTLHKRLDRLLSTSTFRFNEIRENINKELKQYLIKKVNSNTSDEDDDVEILHDDHDDPIFIDENSVDSNVNESQDVDLTVLGSSDHNDSGDKSTEKNEGIQILDPIGTDEPLIVKKKKKILDSHSLTETVDSNKQSGEAIDLESKTNEDAKEPAEDGADIIEIKEKEICVNGDENSTHSKHNDKIEEKVDDEVLRKNNDSQEFIEEGDTGHSISNKKDPDQSLSENKDDDEKNSLSEATDVQDFTDEIIDELLYNESEDKVVERKETAMDVSA